MLSVFLLLLYMFFLPYVLISLRGRFYFFFCGGIHEVLSKVASVSHGTLWSQVCKWHPEVASQSCYWLQAKVDFFFCAFFFFVAVFWKHRLWLTPRRKGMVEENLYAIFKSWGTFIGQLIGSCFLMFLVLYLSLEGLDVKKWHCRRESSLWS